MTLSTDQWHQRYLQQAGWTYSLRQYLCGRVGIQSAARVLEVGCGTGVILKELEQFSPAQSFGLDIDYASLSFSHTYSSRSIITQGDATNLPYQDGAFDCCLCHFLLLWVKHPLNALMEMVRVTHPGGSILALAEPDYGGRIDFPEPLSQIGTWQMDSLKAQGANPTIGRQLRSLFSEAQLIDIEVGILGGQWKDDQPDSGLEIEWDVIRSDLSNNSDFFHKAPQLEALDRAAQAAHRRVLYVPTFYAYGKVAV